jgi:hypothetical protein
MMPYIPRWYWTMSATACVSAAEPDRQHQMVSCTCVSLSVTRLAMYAPVVVRLSAPRITPSLKLIAMIEVPRLTSPLFRWFISTCIPSSPNIPVPGPSIVVERRLIWLRSNHDRAGRAHGDSWSVFRTPSRTLVVSGDNDESERVVIEWILRRLGRAGKAGTRCSEASLAAGFKLPLAKKYA